MNFKKRPLDYARGKGFTLIELLIVIAIIAILAIIVVLTINPATIMEKSRDSARMSDLTSLATAINLYLADSHDFTGLGGSTYTSYDPAGVKTDDQLKQIDSSGWVPIDFRLVSSGAPLAALPLDPENDSATGLYYRFAVNEVAKTYELDCQFENQANQTDKYNSDGGDNPNRYEVGTDLTIMGL